MAVVYGAHVAAAMRLPVLSTSTPVNLRDCYTLFPTAFVLRFHNRSGHGEGL